MKRYRQVISYEDHFEDFLNSLESKVQDKVYKVIEIIETFERIPGQYFKPIKDSKGLFEARIKVSTNIWRILCFFDEGNLVILLNGFVKKQRKTPKGEIRKAVRLMDKYYKEKKKAQ